MTSEEPSPADAGAGGVGERSGVSERSGVGERSGASERRGVGERRVAERGEGSGIPGGVERRRGGEDRRAEEGRRERRASGAGAPAPWQPETLNTETIELLKGRLPLSIRLIGRSSLPGAILVLAIAVLLVGVVPLAAKIQVNASQATGDVIPVGNKVRLTVANDWSVDSQDGRATVLTSGSSQVVIVPAYEESRSAADVVAAEISVVAGDESAPWVVGETSTFTTDEGDSGATVAASSETSATQVWAVSRDGLMTVAVLTTTIESWTTAQPLVREMVDSIVFAEDRSTEDDAIPGPPS